MKTLSIMAIVGMSIIVATSVGVFIEKLGENQQSPYISIMINGMKGNYTVGEPISFSVMLEGYGTGCGDTKAVITKENDTRSQPIGWTSEPQCVSAPNLDNFKFTALSARTMMNQTGNYTLRVTFDNLVTSHHSETQTRFLVTPYYLTGMVAVQNKNNPGINATVYHNHRSYTCPDDAPCFNPLVYYMEISAKPKNFLLNYNICDGDSCIRGPDGEAQILEEDSGTIVRLADRNWSDGDLVDIQIQLTLNGTLAFDKNSAYDSAHTQKIWVDLGKSKIIPEY
jgi:hypothetical protein